MKAKLLFMTLSVAALASCSNDETLDTNRSAISFRSLVEGMTRGTSVTVANLDQFKVIAVATEKSIWTKSPSTARKAEPSGRLKEPTTGPPSSWTSTAMHRLTHRA